MALQSTTAIATVTLQAATPTVTFSGIPNTYRDLILVSKIRSSRPSSDSDLFIQFNGDTSSNYTYVRMLGRSSGANSAANINGTDKIDLGQVPGASATSEEFALTMCEILDYSSTDKHKSVITRANAPGSTSVVGRHAGRWANSANAISSIKIYSNLGSLVESSTFALFGRIA